MPLAARNIFAVLSEDGLLSRIFNETKGLPMSTMIKLIPVTAQSGARYRDRSEPPAAEPGLTPPIVTPYGYVERWPLSKDAVQLKAEEAKMPAF